MGLNVTNYVLQMKGDKSIASGFDHATRTGDNTFSIYFIDGSKVDLTIPLPKDGKDAVDITDVKDLGNGKFTLVLSDGSETSAVQTIKGQKGDKGDKLTFNDLTDEEKTSLKGDSGFSPTITENADNTDKIYKLDITTADSTFTTPNLKGADGQGGTGSGEENVIESIKVNGVVQTVADDKSVDITVPTVDVDKNYVDTELAKKANTSDIPSLDGYVTETELSAKGYLTEHQDISGKVDKVEGKSLISDAEIARLASVDNYDDTDIRTELANKADITAIPTVDVTKSYVDTELVKKANTDHTHTTVNGHTVESDVPENAVFTDTVLEINDADVSKTTVWSSDKVASEIASAIAGGEVDLSAYQKKNDTGLCTMAQDIVGAINEVKEAVDGKINYDDTEVKADITKLQTKAHTHANTEVLNSITSENIQSWNNKSEFDGNYNTLTNKPTLPVKLSDLTNDSGYITNLADDLLNYYKKSDTYSKEEIAELIGNINKLTSEIVESLPTENISTSTIYLIKEGDTNNYKQYMYISGAWAQLSDTNIDLSGYAKLTDLDTKVDKIDGKGLSTNDFTNVLKSKLDGIAEGANKTVVDAELSTTSLNPVQNAVVTTKINTLANKDGSDATGTWGIDISGTAAKATADKNGNDITTTYTKQSDFEKIVGNVDIIDYTSQISKNTDVIASMWSTNIRKVGHIVTFVINITVKAVSGYTVMLGTLPEGVRPSANLSYNTLTNRGEACYIYIDSNGKFGISKITAIKFTANDGVRFCANHITEE